MACLSRPRSHKGSSSPPTIRLKVWTVPQPIVIKVEVYAQGTNRRAVVTNRPGWKVLPSAIYDEYAERGESENRNKELKRELQADRLNDHRSWQIIFGYIFMRLP